jgi:MFS family permease
MWMSEEFSPRRWLALAVTLLALVLDLIDYTIVSIANPSIQHALGSGTTVLEWVTAGYALAYGLGLVSGGGWVTCSVGGGCSWSAWPDSPRPRPAAGWPSGRPC